jgi:hypothetical protein
MSTTPTPPPSHEAIAHRARALWEQSGSPDGLDLTFWFQAEKELLAQQGPETPSAPQVPRVSPGLKQQPGGIRKRGAK